jgi:RimJ/RimL family protein N-acetyltransferase
MFRLRELERKDIIIINKWRNDPDLVASLGAPFRYINADVDNEWFDNYMHNRNNAVRCAIIGSENDGIIGIVSLVLIDTLNQSAEFHIMIGDKENQGKGAGTFAVKAMLDHGFFDLNLRRIELAVLVDNHKAQHLYEKIGFRKEGTKRQVRFKKNKFVDMHQYAILKEEYINNQKK